MRKVCEFAVLNNWIHQLYILRAICIATAVASWHDTRNMLPRLCIESRVEATQSNVQHGHCAAHGAGCICNHESWSALAGEPSAALLVGFALYDPECAVFCASV